MAVGPPAAAWATYWKPYPQKNDPPSPRSQQLLVAPQLGVGLISPSPSMLESDLICLGLLKEVTPAVSSRVQEYNRCVAVSCPEDSISGLFSPSIL